MKKYSSIFTIICLLTAFFSACTEEVPMTVTIDAAQLSIEGRSASLVHVDTSSIVLMRDSVANERRDTIYTLHTSITLVLDSSFTTDQMDTIPELQLRTINGQLLTTLVPANSFVQDSLISFLIQIPGQRTTIDFQGEITRSAMLRLSKEGGSPVFTGFSFFYADPKISNKIVEYQELVTYLTTAFEEGRRNPDSFKSMEGFVRLMVLEQVLNNAEAMDHNLKRKRESMSPLQYARYMAAHDQLKAYYKDL